MLVAGSAEILSRTRRLNLYAYVGDNAVIALTRLDYNGIGNYYQKYRPNNLYEPRYPDAGVVFNEVGYSGTADGGRNTRNAKRFKNVGPIPAGEWVSGARSQ